MYKHVAKYTEGRYCITVFGAHVLVFVLDINNLNFLIMNKEVYVISLTWQNYWINDKSIWLFLIVFQVF